MKVSILTEGGKAIGFGHITRCISLSQAFEEKGIVSEIIVEADEGILDLLKGKNYRIFNWLREKNKLIEIVGNADIVIIDSYLLEKSLYRRVCEIERGRIVIIDDYNRLEYANGFVVNPSIYGDTVNYSQKDSIIYLLGKDYILLREEFWDIPEKKINKKIKKALITFGGMNHCDFIHKIIDYLKERFDLNFFTVDSRKNRLNAKEMLSLMLEVDVCISAGGQTINELARVGVPTIGICFAPNQSLNLNNWARKGFLEFAGWYNYKDLFKKIKKLLISLRYEKRIKMSKIGRRFVDGQGARRVVKEILTYEKN
ncbi:MAG: UDP-2,4-diacetamido-2,4,6-trideoxy-beta-L-altropyranose hydrolase [Candidatus Omnitrophota bacterium]